MAGTGPPVTAECHINYNERKLNSADNSSHDEGISMGSSNPSTSSSQKDASSILSNSSNDQKDAQDDVMQTMMSDLAGHFFQQDTKNPKEIAKKLKSSLKNAISDNIPQQVCDKKSDIDVAPKDAGSHAEDSDGSDDSTGSSISPQSPEEATSMPGGTENGLIILPDSSLTAATEVR